MRVLGIETSCDETAAAVVEDGCKLLSSAVASSMVLHVQYGGVVPEIAARSHIEAIIPVIEQALADAQTDWSGIDAIAVTYGAGLGGSLLIGVLTARTLAIVHNKPLYAINHAEGHVYANFITHTLLPSYIVAEKQPAFPMLALIVSGGHSQLALFRNHFDYTLLGQTRDDAIGEAFDKVAKILGLPYPGGPNLDKKALEGDPARYPLPKAKMGPRPRIHHSDEAQGSGEKRKAAYTKVRQLSIADDPGVPKSRGFDLGKGNAAIRAVVDSGKYDFSFSGLKTAVLRLAQAEIDENFSFPSYELAARLSEAQKADIAASFQRTAFETVVDKTIAAYEEFHPHSVVLAGGVAASPALRELLTARLPVPIQYPHSKLCTDNAAMIAALGCFKLMHHQPEANPYRLEINPNLSM